jgi:hypothetical protein
MLAVGETRIEDPGDVRAAREERGHGRCVGNVALDAEVERPEAAEHEEAVKRAGHRAHRVLQEPQPLADRRVTGHRDPEDRVGVTPEVLRRGMEGDIGTELEGVLEGRRREGIVDDQIRAGPAGLVGVIADRPGGGGDVGELQVGVRWTLEPDDPRSSRQLLPEGLRVDRQVREPCLGGPARTVDPLKVAVRPAVDVVADQDLLAAPGELGDRRGRCRAAREGDPLRAPLEGGDRALEPRRGRLTPSWAYVEVW